MLSTTAKPESVLYAALIVRNEFGELVEPQPTSPIPIDQPHVEAEVRRLRSLLGPKFAISSEQILSARLKMAAQNALAA